MNGKIKRGIKVEIARFPFRVGKIIRFTFSKLFKGSYLSYVPDKYAFNYQWHQRHRYAFYNQKYINGWVNNAYLNNAGDLVRFFFLSMVLEQISKEDIRGDMAEVGVYKGNSAFLFAEYARKADKQLFLFDSFSGFDERDLKGMDGNKKASFQDTDLESVKRKVGLKNVHYIDGYFPDSLSQMKEPKPSVFCLVHIDCDLEKPTTESLNYFYPKMSKGGFLIVHDYLNWDGATRAVDEFLKDKVEKLVPIPDKSGSVVIRKV
jgi:hypothetical protein